MQAWGLEAQGFEAVAVDTTVQEKNIAHPTEHALLSKAVNKLGDLARRAGIKLRQSYTRVVKKAAIKGGRYIHAKQMKRAKRKLKFIQICERQEISYFYEISFLTFDSIMA